MYYNFVLRKEYKTSLLQLNCPFSYIVIPLARNVGKTFIEIEYMLVERDKDDIIHALSYETRCVCFDKNHNEFIQTLIYRCSASDMLRYSPAVHLATDDIPA